MHSIQDNPAPTVALVGRPNVGKSTLFNRLVGRRTALVHNTPGVTRDRLFGTARNATHAICVVDTGGIDPDDQRIGAEAVRRQTQLAMATAHLIFLVVDVTDGIHPLDSEIVALLRRTHTPLALVVNKVDHAARSHGVADFYRLGITPVLAVSAEHNLGFDAVWELLTARLPASKIQVLQIPPEAELEAEEEDAASAVEPWQDKPIHVAVVGRPNAGKSSLINAILGEERHVTSPVPGTTCDAVDSWMQRDQQTYLWIDTAGIRRKRSIIHTGQPGPLGPSNHAGRLESLAVMAAWNAMDRSDVVLLVLDGTLLATQQDARIATMAHKKGKGLVVVITKWDKVENPAWLAHVRHALRTHMPFAAYAPQVLVSAQTGRGLDRLFQHMAAIQAERHRRIGTGELNRAFQEIIAAHPPPMHRGRRPQLYYVSQPLIRPPTFVFATSRCLQLSASYLRYLENALRKRYPFAGTPLWMKFRAHQR